MNTPVHCKTPPCAPDRLLRFAEVRPLVGISRSKIYQLIAEGSFPRPTKVGTRSLFSENEIQAWVAERLDARTQKAA